MRWNRRAERMRRRGLDMGRGEKNKLNCKRALGWKWGEQTLDLDLEAENGVKKSENPQRPRVSLFTWFACALSPTKLSPPATFAPDPWQPGGVSGGAGGAKRQRLAEAWRALAAWWWMPRKKRHRGGAKAWKPRNLLSPGLMLQCLAVSMAWINSINNRASAIASRKEATWHRLPPKT
ncbi:uncharacterized protein TrAtP1_004945 [Trichoderma atroviride]|uniref:uncharacterized protein n=1 Tax=Hypocrea atroviridis TaxID=63577 RepID=UPI00332D8B06|nr:hypothetical protein TrAtP1_004945 [Trichoderma atroviride]